MSARVHDEFDVALLMTSEVVEAVKGMREILRRRERAWEKLERVREVNQRLSDEIGMLDGKLRAAQRKIFDLLTHEHHNDLPSARAGHY